MRAPDDPVEVLVGRRELAGRVAEMGRSIADDTAPAGMPLVAIGILKGSAIFLADLVRSMVRVDVEVDFMAISSYAQDNSTTGKVRILKDLERDIGGRDVLIVEDIVDTGLTLSYLRKTLAAREPRSLRSAALLDKRVRRIVPVPIEYVGFEVPDVFVVGYGLDWQGRYRNVRGILGLREPEDGDEQRGLLDAFLGADFGEPG